LELTDDIRTLRGIGEKTAKAMAKQDIHTIRDLINHYPRGYEDKSRITPVAELQNELFQLVQVTVTSPASIHRLRSGKLLVQAETADETGGLMLCFFNQEYMKNTLKTGETYLVYGKPSGARLTKDMINPQVTRLDGEFQAEIAPLYPLTDGLRQSDLRKAVRQALDGVLDKVTDSLPNAVRQKYELATAKFALGNIHFPSSDKACELSRKRLIFGEFFTLAAAMKLYKKSRKTEENRPYDISVAEEFLSALPFTMTDAQMRTVEEILSDFKNGLGMHRLVQGDVGSGKTVVAAAAAFVTARNKAQVALMAPTEILAEQHMKTFENFLSPFRIPCALLTASTPTARRREILDGLEKGGLSVIVGTQALLEEKVVFHELGLVICDEQHRFGVEQRSRLAAKGKEVNTLVMSATPIPRTLALVMYGDLDVSVIDRLPPGRQKVDTFTIGEEHRERLYGFIRRQVEEGRQAYVVCPLVEENEELDLTSAESYVDRLQHEIFPDLRVGLLHGKMKAAEKNDIMLAFSRGEIDILVSTTVIEVGIDVPNATLIIIENAERFGLSQLHQLRGRVGRGQYKSYCFLMSDAPADSIQRLKVMTSTNDGFKVAQADLELRGPGDFFGKRQHGLPEMMIASFQDDVKTLSIAQHAAEEVLEDDPELEKEENRLMRKAVLSMAARLERN